MREKNIFWWLGMTGFGAPLVLIVEQSMTGIGASLILSVEQVQPQERLALKFLRVHLCDKGTQFGRFI